ncbi:MAG: DNA adenine methylase [Candidatus Hydrogenedentes bacterium]|nr:DNA adenine methylase [Candidatus Hydrogenedentota bacterium]
MSPAKSTRNDSPRPFLKWVGGKGQLLAPLYAAVKAAGKIERYHEPFVGGGALFFCLYREGALGPGKALLGDANARLVETYLGIQRDVEALIALLEKHESLHSKDHYYATRAEVPGDTLARAARIIYLNKTCFNGLYRENSKGLFNVPMGAYKKPPICDPENLRHVHTALQCAHIEQASFESIVNSAKPGGLVYFDPPYHPVSQTASFTSYHETGFGEDAQRELARVAAALDQAGVRFILSNSDTPFINELYKKFKIQKVLAGRNVNSRSDRRGKVSEVLVQNY